MDKYAENRAALADAATFGHKLVQQLQALRNSTETVEKPRKKSSGKPVSINLRVKKSDLALLDAIAEHFGIPRSHLLERLVSDDIETMFSELYGRDQYTLAQIVDQEITNQGFENEHRGRTWYWDVLENLAYSGLVHLDNPMCEENILPWRGL